MGVMRICRVGDNVGSFCFTKNPTSLEDQHTSLFQGRKRLHIPQRERTQAEVAHKRILLLSTNTETHTRYACEP